MENCTVQATIDVMPVQVLTLKPSDNLYPPLLKEIHDPPDPLYLRGTLEIGDRLVVAVVGSRKATSYGRQVVKQLIEPLAAAGVVIVSGLAFGIDGAAHEAALAVGGLTVAVLGTPIDRIYPPSHTHLVQRLLAQGGAIVSEVPSGGETHRGSFPRRNRIIAGMSHATIVIEAAFDSGSLITARCALDENRDVFVVPGPITSLVSAGTNNLLKLGARPVTEPNDVLGALGQPLLAPLATPLPRNLTAEEATIIGQLSPTEPLHIDNLIKLVTIDLPILQSQLSLLEIRGLVRMIQPGYYVRL